MPALAYALAGIFGCVLQESALLNIKPDIAYRGVVGSSILDFDVHPSFTLNDNTLALCRHCGLDPQSLKQQGEHNKFHFR